MVFNLHFRKPVHKFDAIGVLIILAIVIFIEKSSHHRLKPTFFLFKKIFNRFPFLIFYVYELFEITHIVHMHKYCAENSLQNVYL